jgi:glucose-1-phosphate adenylyltransferase
MKRLKVLALIMAGGEGNRMELLTDVRAKPALPYAGVYRLLDFPLSNCMHSGIDNVWVIEQFLPYSLNDHLASGRPWDLDRTYGGLRIIQPHTGTNEGGWHQGNADAIYRNQRFIREFNPDLMLVLSADHIYKLDYNDVIDQHLANAADVTMVTTQVSHERARQFGTVQVGESGKVTHFEYKPDTPHSDIVTTEVFVYTASTLLDMLEELVAQRRDYDDGEAALKDFGHELIPALVERGRAYSYPLAGYWRDVGTIEAYWQSHMDLLEPEPPLNLDEPKWPILTFGVQRLPARIYQQARIENSLIAPGCQIRGRVINSVLAPGVVVEEGAVVRNSIVFNDTQIQAHAQVSYTIIDSNVSIEAWAHVGQDDSRSEADEREPSKPNITLVGQRARVPQRVHIAAGARVEPDAVAVTSEQATQAGA